MTTTPPNKLSYGYPLSCDSQFSHLLSKSPSQSPRNRSPSNSMIDLNGKESKVATLQLSRNSNYDFDSSLSTSRLTHKKQNTVLKGCCSGRCIKSFTRSSVILTGLLTIVTATSALFQETIVEELTKMANALSPTAWGVLEAGGILTILAGKCLLKTPEKKETVQIEYI